MLELEDGIIFNDKNLRLDSIIGDNNISNLINQSRNNSSFLSNVNNCKDLKE